MALRSPLQLGNWNMVPRQAVALLPLACPDVDTPLSLLPMPRCVAGQAVRAATSGRAAPPAATEICRPQEGLSCWAPRVHVRGGLKCTKVRIGRRLQGTDWTTDVLFNPA